MNTQDFRNIQQAYNEVYNELDEGIGSAIKSLFGKKKELEAQKPESRGAQLRARYNVGPEKSDTSAKRQILDRSRARAEKDEKEYGDSKYSKSVAQKSKAAHDKYLKAGYSKYGAGDARGSGNKARKRAAALNREEFEYDAFDVVLEYLVVEGYADTNESALVIMANMSEEWRQSIVEVKLDPRGRPASGPMNVYKQSKPNNDPAFQAALKSVRDADAKKTPEQRKAELDAYKERQMNR